MIKLVASDLDGTLLHNYDTIKALHEKGIIFTAASGRQYANIRRLFAPLGFDIPYIAENGSMCVYKEEILATGLTPSKTIRHILDALMEYRKIYHTGHWICMRSKNRSSKQPSVILVAQRIWNPSSTKESGMKSAL